MDLKRVLTILKFLSINDRKQIDLFYEYGPRENLAFENISDFNSSILPSSQSDCPTSRIFWSRNDCPVYLAGQKFEAQSQIFSANFPYQEVFRHCNFQGHFRVVVVFYFKSHTYNYLVNGQRALISPKLETRTILLERREYNVVISISRHVKNHSSMAIVPHLCEVA